MAQKPQIIDLKKSYLPIDPNAFAANLVNTNKEDGEEKTFPILPYEGYNFLPTDYGYRSYFGQNSKLGVAALTSRTQFILSYQTLNLHNWLVALCEDGIWIVDTSVGGAWNHIVTHSFDADVFEEWTYCVIENVLYMYKQGYPSYYKTTEVAQALSITTATPNFLNMDGQMGIFKAGTRLGFWDSLNSISWSSTFDFTDFTPSLETLAGNVIFAECVGRITHIRNHDSGYIVYCTGSIVGVQFSETGELVWDGRKLLDAGVINPRSITTGHDNKEHFAWTTAGVIHIKGYSPMGGKYEFEFILPELFDLLREDRNPIYLDCIQDRYLCFQVFTGRYVYSRSSTVATMVDPTRTAVLLGEEYWDGDVTVLPATLDGNTIRTLMEQWAQGNDPAGLSNSCL